MTKGTRREREKLELKSAVFDTVIRLAREGGWGNVSIRKISQEVEYSTIMIYDLFGSKDSLFVELMTNIREKIKTSYRKAA